MTADAATNSSPLRGPGRPRRLDDAAESRRLLDAALIMLRNKGYEDATVADILAEAGISTRAFYRHFQSKDQLIVALYRRDAERARRRPPVTLRRRR